MRAEHRVRIFWIGRSCVLFRTPRSIESPRSIRTIGGHDVIEPPRPLGTEGRKAWDSLAGKVDEARLLAVCESVDERQVLRLAVFRGGTHADRSGLRVLERQIAAALDALARSALWHTYAQQLTQEV